MEVTVRLFASLRDAVGTGSVSLQIKKGARLTDLEAALVARYPQLDGTQPMWHFAVNQTHVEADTVLQAGDRIAIFPYIAGG